jgi:hypothetical protein
MNRNMHPFKVDRIIPVIFFDFRECLIDNNYQSCYDITVNDNRFQWRGGSFYEHI